MHRWDSSDRRVTLPRNWPTIARRILRRDQVCTECTLALSTEVDHIDGRHDHRDSNLRGLCAKCHRDKTLRQAADARQAQAVARYREPEPHPGMIEREA